MADQAVAYPYCFAREYRYGMPDGSTWSLLWFSSMITSTLVTPGPVDAGALPPAGGGTLAEVARDAEA
jgi:hypothetical protein